MTPAESVEAFRIIQALPPVPQVVVSAGNLHTRLAQWISHGQGNESDEVAPTSAELRQHSRPELKSQYQEPQNDIQEKVSAMWAQLLGLDRVGIHDNFFELGGHSLLGTRVLARVQELFAVKLPLRAIFEAPTVAELAEKIQALQWTASEEPEIAASSGEELEELQF
jgi:acyl carrier protein